MVVRARQQLHEPELLRQPADGRVLRAGRIDQVPRRTDRGEGPRPRHLGVQPGGVHRGDVGCDGE